MAPRTKAAAQGSPMVQWATTATTHVVISTRPTASSEIGRRFARKSRQEVKIAGTEHAVTIGFQVGALITVKAVYELQLDSVVVTLDEARDRARELITTKNTK